MKKLKVLGKGEEDLVKNSAIMNDIDEQADHDNTSNLVGGSAYDSSSIDKLTTARLLNIQTSGEKQKDEHQHKFAKNSFKNILIIILSIFLILILIFVITQVINGGAT